MDAKGDPLLDADNKRIHVTSEFTGLKAKFDPRLYNQWHSTNQKFGGQDPVNLDAEGHPIHWGCGNLNGIPYTMDKSHSDKMLYNVPEPWQIRFRIDPAPGHKTIQPQPEQEEQPQHKKKTSNTNRYPAMAATASLSLKNKIPKVVPIPSLNNSSKLPLDESQQKATTAVDANNNIFLENQNKQMRNQDHDTNDRKDRRKHLVDKSEYEDTGENVNYNFTSQQNQNLSKRYDDHDTNARLERRKRFYFGDPERNDPRDDRHVYRNDPSNDRHVYYQNDPRDERHRNNPYDDRHAHRNDPGDDRHFYRNNHREDTSIKDLLMFQNHEHMRHTAQRENELKLRIELLELSERQNRFLNSTRY